MSDVPFTRCRYFSFWDVPRTLVFEFDHRTFFLDCQFDDKLDDYSSMFVVWQLSPTSWEELCTLSFDEIEKRRTQQIENLPVGAIKFDTLRERSSGMFFAKFQFVGLSPPFATS